MADLQRKTEAAPDQARSDQDAAVTGAAEDAAPGEPGPGDGQLEPQSTQAPKTLVMGTLAGIAAGYLIARRTFDLMWIRSDAQGYQIIALIVGAACGGALLSSLTENSPSDVRHRFNKLCLILICVAFFVWALWPNVG